jgi:hypothetical protein
VLNTSLDNALEIEGADTIQHWFDQAIWVLEQERTKKK